MSKFVPDDATIVACARKVREITGKNPDENSGRACLPPNSAGWIWILRDLRKRETTLKKLMIEHGVDLKILSTRRCIGLPEDKVIAKAGIEVCKLKGHFPRKEDKYLCLPEGSISWPAIIKRLQERGTSVLALAKKFYPEEVANLKRERTISRTKSLPPDDVIAMAIDQFRLLHNMRFPVDKDRHECLDKNGPGWYVIRRRIKAERGLTLKEFWEQQRPELQQANTDLSAKDDLGKEIALDKNMPEPSPAPSGPSTGPEPHAKEKIQGPEYITPVMVIASDDTLTQSPIQPEKTQQPAQDNVERQTSPDKNTPQPSTAPVSLKDTDSKAPQQASPLYKGERIQEQEGLIKKFQDSTKTFPSDDTIINATISMYKAYTVFPRLTDGHSFLPEGSYCWAFIIQKLRKERHVSPRDLVLQSLGIHNVGRRTPENVRLAILGNDGKAMAAFNAKGKKKQFEPGEEHLSETDSNSAIEELPESSAFYGIDVASGEAEMLTALAENNDYFKIEDLKEISGRTLAR